MSDILRHVDIHVHCGQCGDYTLPAAVIAESQRMLAQGCPGSRYECPPELLSTLVDPEALVQLEQAWQRVEESALRRADGALVRDRPRVEAPVGAARSTPWPPPVRERGAEGAGAEQTGGEA